MTSLDDIMRLMPAMSWDTATKIRAAIEEYASVRDVSPAEVDVSKVAETMHELGWGLDPLDREELPKNLRTALTRIGVRVTGGAS